jgi:O-antigen/teichoic acid export membrane protein
VDSLGAFAVTFSAVHVAAVISKTGFDGALTKHLATVSALSPEWLVVRKVFRRIFIRALLLSLFLCLCAAGYLYLRKTGEPALAQANYFFYFMLLSIPAYAVTSIGASIFKGLSKPAFAAIFEPGYTALLTALLLFTQHSFFDNQLSEQIAIAYFLATLSFAAGSVAASRLFFSGPSKTRPCIEYSDLEKSSQSFRVISFSSLINTSAVYLISPTLLNANEIGILRACQQLASLVGFALLVLNAVMPAQISASFKNGALVSLRSSLAYAKSLALLLAAPVTVLLLLFPSWPLKLMDSGLIEHSGILRVLSVAQCIAVVVGTDIFLLSMTEHERLAKNISLMSSGFNLLLFTASASIFGLAGAALAMAIGMISQGAIAALCVRSLELLRE